MLPHQFYKVFSLRKYIRFGVSHRSSFNKVYFFEIWYQTLLNVRVPNIVYLPTDFHFDNLKLAQIRQFTVNFHEIQNLKKPYFLNRFWLNLTLTIDILYLFIKTISQIMLKLGLRQKFFKKLKFHKFSSSILTLILQNLTLFFFHENIYSSMKKREVNRRISKKGYLVQH